MVLSKELALYERNEKGELIPQEVPLVATDKDFEAFPALKGQTVKVVPLTRGELNELFSGVGKKADGTPDTDRDADAELIVKYCKAPVFTLEEAKFMRPVFAKAIVNTILVESGVKFDEKAGTKKIDDNDEFGKN